MRVPAAILLLTLLAPTGCSLSSNQSKGLMYAGGAAVFMGGVITVDGVTCDETAGGEQACGEDKNDLYAGLTLMGVGLVLGSLGYFLREKKTTTAAE